MKVPSEDLHALVHALTPSERRYFRKFASRHIAGEDNQYLHLFDALCQMPVYDEKELKKRLTDYKIGGYLAVGKRYLYEQIGECLRQFHKEKLPDEKIKEQLFFISLLLQRNLPAQAKKIIYKTKKEINRYQFFHLMPELLELERTWMDRTFYRENSTEDLGAWSEQYRYVLEQLSDLSQQAQLGMSIARLHYRKVTMVEAASRLDIERLLNEAPPPAGNLRAQLDRLKALSTWYFMNSQAEAAYTCNKEMLALMEQHPFLVTLEPKRYLVALNNFLIDNHQLKRYDELAEGLVKLKSLTENKAFQQIPGIEEKIFEQSTLLELNTWIDRAQFAEAHAQLPGIIAQLKACDHKIGEHYRLTFYYLIAYIFFENKDFDEALSWLGLLLQQPQKNVVEEIFRFARWLQILAHFEQGHDQLVEYLLQAQRRQLDQHQSFSQTERLVFFNLKKLVNAANDKERNLLFESLLQQLTQLQDQAHERRVMAYFNFEAWCRKHLS